MLPWLILQLLIPRFIDSAKRESIDEVLELCTLKTRAKIKKIVVTGCLAERYKEEIHKDILEVDVVIGIGANGEIAEKLNEMMGGQVVESFLINTKCHFAASVSLPHPAILLTLKLLRAATTAVPTALYHL